MKIKIIIGVLFVLLLLIIDYGRRNNFEYGQETSFVDPQSIKYDDQADEEHAIALHPWEHLINEPPRSSRIAPLLWVCIFKYQWW